VRSSHWTHAKVSRPYLVPDDATHGCTTDRADWATVGQYGTTYGTNASANRCILIPLRHARTANHTKQTHAKYHTKCRFL
jgi:hypothetical protein